MAMDEFSLIRRYFNRLPRHASVLLGVGDDGALWRPTPGLDLAIAADMLLAERHFFADEDPAAIGHKALAVNLSDMAAMGAQPRAVTLCLALPHGDAAWLDGFAAGFWELADQYGIDLIGGDTTRGPLTIAIQVWGELLPGTALLRSGARCGDDIWISGRLGGAAVALQHRLGNISVPPSVFERCQERLLRPQPRVQLGLQLGAVASAAIDISDGLLSDLGHILQASQCGAEISYSAIALEAGLAELRNQPLVREAVLAGGDDYELCFTAPADKKQVIQQLAEQTGIVLSCIGSIRDEPGIIIKGESGEELHVGRTGYNHFAAENS